MHNTTPRKILAHGRHHSNVEYTFIYFFRLMVCKHHQQTHNFQLCDRCCGKGQIMKVRRVWNHHGVPNTKQVMRTSR